MVILQTHYKAWGNGLKFTPANTRYQNSNWENSVPTTGVNCHLECTLANARLCAGRALPVLSDPILHSAECKSMVCLGEFLFSFVSFCF